MSVDRFFIKCIEGCSNGNDLLEKKPTLCQALNNLKKRVGDIPAPPEEVMFYGGDGDDSKHSANILLLRRAKKRLSNMEAAE
jgi:hypothetical protein